MLHTLEEIYRTIAEVGILALESIGLFIILYTAIKALILLLRRDAHIRVSLGEGIALALEFMLGGEVLRTTLENELARLAVVGVIVVLRFAMTYLIHWEVRTEEEKLKSLHQ